MAITLRRQLNDEEKIIVIKQHGRQCFATGHLIPDGEPLHFDHIRAYSLGGVSEIGNIAPMCAQHNKEKGQLPLFDFRIKLQLHDFFSQGDKLTLRDLLSFLRKQKEIQSFGQPIAVLEHGTTVTVESASQKYNTNLSVCPITEWKYFYATLDVDVIDSDDDKDETIALQPRYLIFDKVFELFRHLQQHPVLQPSIGRIVGNHIRVFDGQHKIAALLWNGRRSIECKVYLKADTRLLNNTNIAAHDKFSQTRFFSSIMVMKLGMQFGSDFETYKNLDDGLPKSEEGFITYLSKKEGGVLTPGELNTRFKDYLYNSVLQNDDNRLSALVSSGNRSTDEKPLTIDMLSKSLFSCFLYREPSAHNMATEAYLREAEVNNMIKFMNMFHELGLEKWNPKAGPSDENQRKLNRIFRSKAMMAWSEILRDAICAKLELHDSDEKATPFYRELADQDFKKIRDVVCRLMSWKMWSAPGDHEIDRILADNKSAVKTWLKDKKLTTGYLMGASE